MSHSQSLRSKFLLMPAMLVALLALISLTTSGVAHAEEPKGYGELTRFGETGDEKGHLDELRTRAIGVDPTDNSVYVADEPKEPNNKAGSLVREIRVQKFKASAEGKYTLSASASFTETSTPLSKDHEVPPVEGIAVDPKAKKVYLLLADIRAKTLGQDKETSSGAELFVASTLYAFATQETGESLLGAGKEGPNSEILTGPEALHAQSETPGAAILQPRGITVDPGTGEAIIFGHVDPNKTALDSLSSDHYAAQRIHADGSLASTYVDTTNVLKKELESSFSPSSPVVVEAAGKEHLELLYGGLVELPSEGAPKRISLAPETGIAQGISGTPSGGRLSAAPDGTVWGATGSIKNESATEPFYAGLTAFSGSDGSEIGWTGGQAAVEPTRTLDKCVIEPYGKSEVPHLVAAGSGGKVFALAPEFLLTEEEEIVEEEEEEIVIKRKLPGPFFPAVIEFGPGGSGCPGASATVPVARVGGNEVKGEEPVSPGATVAFSSQVKQADALKVEWDFGDGSAKQVVASDQFQTTHGEHKYEKEGTYTVTETIYSDNLAAPSEAVYTGGKFTNPKITVTRTLLVSKPHPKPAFSVEPSTVAVGQEATFSGEASDANGAPALPLEYAWSFGDGAESAASGARTVKHAYAAGGTYTITLTVTDHLGFKGVVTHSITVLAPGGGETPPTTTTTPPPPPPAGGVLPYQVSVARTTLAATRAGMVGITVQCLGKSSCTGTVTLRTLTAVSAKAHKQILTLGTASFSTIAGGQSRSVNVHLSAKALKLLARSHTLRVRATILAKGSDGAIHTNQITVTIRAYKGKHH